MLHEKRGDIFQNTTGIIMHGCNCYGVMGAGVAKIVKDKYTLAYKKYAELCAEVDSPRDLLGATHCPLVLPNLYIANCFTQVAPGPCADAAAIKECLVDVMRFAREMNLPVHSVQIGCGIGGLKWDDVRLIYEQVDAFFPDVDLTVWSLQ